MPTITGSNAEARLDVRLIVVNPVDPSVALETLEEVLITPAGVQSTVAFAALCLVKVIGPVPAASLIVVALISDNAQVPP
jgi:hypothetical protein